MSLLNIENLPSIQKFKKHLIKEIPFVPNNKISQDFLLDRDVGTLLHIYDFWKHRTISARPRKVLTENHVRNDSLYTKNVDKIKILRKILESGQDINLFLSNKIRQGSFDVEDFKNTREFNGSRDEMLVCAGFYHFHLEPYPQRTDEVLVGIVTDERVEFVGIFTHQIFENENESNEKMHRKFNESINIFAQKKYPQGGYFIGGIGGGMQNLAGSSFSSSMSQIEKVKIISRVELHEGGIEAFTRKLYSYLHSREPKKVNPEWTIDHRSLNIYERANKVTFCESKLRLSFNPRVKRTS